MNYVLQSNTTKLFFNFKTKGWVDKPINGTLFKSYNPLRFIAKWYVSKKYEPVGFHGVLFLKANFKILDKLNMK